MRGISWLAEDLLASQEGLCSKELVIMHNTDLPKYLTYVHNATRQFTTQQSHECNHISMAHSNCHSGGAWDSISTKRMTVSFHVLNNSLIVLSFDAYQSILLTASWNKQKQNNLNLKLCLGDEGKLDKTDWETAT